MDAKKLERFRNRVTFISGSSKNAGKTTFLNYLLPRLRTGGDLVYLSVGIDGEKKDRVFGNEKPAIEAVPGDYVITCEDMMNESSALFQICHVYPWKTALGKLLLLSVKRSGLVELAGPEANSQLMEIITHLRGERGIPTVIVDGAVNRITQLAAGKDSSYYYVMRVTPENRSSAITTIRVLNLLDRIPSWEERGRETAYFHQGALTSTSLKAIPKDTESLVLEDFTKVFLPWRELRELAEKVKVYFCNVFTLEGLVLNLYNLDQSEFEQNLKEAGIVVPYIFNPFLLEKRGL